MIKVAVIGCGYWGPNLVRNFHQLPACQLTACCDLAPDRLMAMRRLYPQVKTTERYEDIFADAEIEAVAIATPAATHFHLAKAALNCGKHVLVEKPLTLNSAEARQLMALAEAANRVLMVGHTFEYNPAVAKIKQLLAGGDMGQLYYAHSTRTNLGRMQQDINALWSIAPHDISILIYLLDSLPLTAMAIGQGYLNHGVQDVVFVTLVFPGQVMAHIHASWLDPRKVRSMTFAGSKKMVVYDDLDNEGKIRIYDKGIRRQGEEVYGEFHYKLHLGDICIPSIDSSEPLRNECAHFLECIKQGRRPLSDGNSGLRVVLVLEAAQKSLELGGVPVEVKW